MTKRIGGDLGKILSNRIDSIKRKSKDRGIEYSIERTDLYEIYKKQNGMCAYTSRPMELKTGTAKWKNPEVLSVDRIDPSRGYHKDNVHLIRWCVNEAKNRMPHEEFLQMSKDVTETNKLKEEQNATRIEHYLWDYF